MVTSKHEQTIDRLILNVVQAEERNDTTSAEFLNRCLVAAIKASEQPVGRPRTVRIPVFG